MIIRKYGIAAGCVAAAAAAFLLIADAEGIRLALISSSESCLTVIIPSLFGFMVLSEILTESGIYRYLLRPLHFLFGRILSMELYPFTVFILSLLGGYPVGARLLSKMADDERNAPLCQNMLCYCYCPSPSFAVTVMGLCVFGSVQAGLIIYLSNVISCVFTALFINKISRHAFFDIQQKTNEKKNNIILCSVTSTARALFKVCSVILFFALVIELLRFMGVFTAASFLGGEFLSLSVSSFIEISGITALYNTASNPLALPVAAAASSFGGLCILFQTAALTNGKIKLKRFILSRFPTAFFSAIAACFLAKLFPFAVTTGVNSVKYVQISSVKPLTSAFLIVMCAILLKNCKKISKKGSIF